MAKLQSDILFAIDTSLDPSFPITVIKVHRDKKGNTLGILAKVQDKKILFQGIYGPNSDDPKFDEKKLFQFNSDSTPDFSIFCGDWNITLDPKLDTKNYTRIGKQNPKAREKLVEKIDKLGLIDVFKGPKPKQRMLHLEKVV